MAVEKIINDLVGYDNLKIVQCKDYFNFSLESVLLPNFVTIKKDNKNIIDLGCGNAPMPLILNYLYPNLDIYAIEVQPKIFELAKETLEINKLDNKIKLYNEDIKDIKKLFEHETFDTVICNPPYFNKESRNKVNKNDIKTVARHEILITLEEIIEKAVYLLKNKGNFAIVHRAIRLNDIIVLFRKYNLEPKRLQVIYSKEDSDAKLIMLEGIKNGGEGLKILKPLIIHDKKGNYTEEVEKRFNGKLFPGK